RHALERQQEFLQEAVVGPDARDRHLQLVVGVTHQRIALEHLLASPHRFLEGAGDRRLVRGHPDTGEHHLGHPDAGRVEQHRGPPRAWWSSIAAGRSTPTDSRRRTRRQHTVVEAPTCSARSWAESLASRCSASTIPTSIASASSDWDICFPKSLLMGTIIPNKP